MNFINLHSGLMTIFFVQLYMHPQHSSGIYSARRMHVCFEDFRQGMNNAFNSNLLVRLFDRSDIML